MPAPRPLTRLLVALTLAVLVLAGCRQGPGAGPEAGPNSDPRQVDALPAPELGACRRLTPQDVAAATNATRTVDCREPHTAQTYAVGTMPGALADAAYDDRAVGAFAYDTCSKRFLRFLGADESLSMRTVLSWAWFRPSPAAWEQGARWYRCDVVGGGEQSRRYVDLPADARGLLLKATDRWLVCVQGPSVTGSVKIPCSRPHDWRAISTIVVDDASAPYPGDRLVEVRSRDFCSASVGALLGYPVDYDFGYTWFHEAEWQAGNRRSVCWARTDA